MHRIGIIGPGGIAQSRHLPGFAEASNAKVTALSVRNIDKGKTLSAEWGIEHVFESADALIASPDIDAVCIATWPNTHAELTIRALEAGKPVLCQARMARNLAEAGSMVQAAAAHPALPAYLVPAPATLHVDSLVEDIIESGRLGALYALDAYERGDALWSPKPAGWRNQQATSGENILFMGTLYESIERWIGPATWVQAHLRQLGPQADGVDSPNHVDILAEFEGGIAGRLSFSAVTGGAPANMIWIYGSKGSLCFNVDTEVLYQKLEADADWVELARPDPACNPWTVEADFVRLLDGGHDHGVLTSFEAGYSYMAFTDAVWRSHETGARYQVQRHSGGPPRGA